MKTPSDELFLLIKSLSSQEKAQFKVYASRRKEDSNYIRIFDAIDKQEKYDEVLLKKCFKNTSFIKYLYRIKPYIQESILKCLQEYYSSDSVDAVLCNHIQQIEILMNKRLFSLVKKQIEKAEKIALENHHYLYLLHIRSWKQKAKTLELDVAGLRKHQQEWNANESQYLTMYKNILEFQNLYIPIAIHTISHLQNLNEQATTELHTILNNPLLKKEAQGLSYPGKLMRHRILGDVYFLLKDYKNSYLHLKKVIHYFEPASLGPNERLNIYSKMILLLCRLRRDKEVVLIKNEAVGLVFSLPKKLQTNALFSRYLSIMNNYIAYHLSLFKMQEALSSGDDVQSLLVKHASLQTLGVFYCNRFTIHFVMADYHRALQCSNKVLTMEKTGIRGDLISLMKILNIAVHYELGNQDMLSNLCKSTTTAMHKNGSLGEAEKLLLDFFGRIILKAQSKREQEKRFMELKNELTKYKTKKILIDFDFISWAESKIENRALLDILKEKIRA